MLINNHDIETTRGKIRGQLPLEQTFAFCKTFKKITKNLGFPIMFKTADLQDFIYTTLADVIQKMQQLMSSFYCSYSHPKGYNISKIQRVYYE